MCLGELAPPPESLIHHAATDLRAKLADLAPLDTPESRWAANQVRRELALLEQCLESVRNDGPEYALCIDCRVVTASPDALQ